MKVTAHGVHTELISGPNHKRLLRDKKPAFLPDYILLGYSAAADICIQLFQLSTLDKGNLKLNNRVTVNLTACALSTQSFQLSEN